MMDAVAHEEIPDVLSRYGYGFTCFESLSDLEIFARKMGEIRVDSRIPEGMRAISPQMLEEARANTLSSRYGMAPFPFHTDVAHWSKPAAFVVLFCISPGSGQRPTLLIDTKKWNLTSAEKNAICSDVWSSGHLNPQLVCIGEEDHSGSIGYRFDLACMKPQTAKAESVKNFVGERILCSSVVEINWSSGACLIIDNKRILHARGAATAPDEDRVLIRILVG